MVRLQTRTKLCEPGTRAKTGDWIASFRTAVTTVKRNPNRVPEISPLSHSDERERDAVVGGLRSGHSSRGPTVGPRDGSIGTNPRWEKNVSCEKNLGRFD